LVELFAVCDAEDEPIPPATDPDRWAQEMDAAGSLTTERTPGLDTDEDPTAGVTTPNGPADAAEVSADDEDQATIAAADGAEEDGRLLELNPKTRQAVARLERVERADPDLDGDLAAYEDQGTSTRPGIGILGEPVVRAAGKVPTNRHPWYCEVMVYLALHPRGVTADKALTDLWPDGRGGDGKPVAAVTLRRAMSAARQWVGGEAYLPAMGAEGLYRLRGHLLDWDLFRRLRKRAEARQEAGHDGAVADYRAALRLVRGPVLSPLRPGGYAWLTNPDQQHDVHIPGVVTDTTHALVDLALAADDLALARWAAEVALLVDEHRSLDRPMVDLMRVLHAEGHLGEAERVARQLLALTEVDVPEQLSPETCEAITALFPSGLRPTGT